MPNIGRRRFYTLRRTWGMPLNAVEKTMKYGGNAFSYYGTADDAYKFYNNKNLDNATNFGLDISGFISLPLCWFSTWTFKVAPVLGKSIDNEGYDKKIQTDL